MIGPTATGILTRCDGRSARTAGAASCSSITTSACRICPRGKIRSSPVKLPGGSLTFPETAVTVPANDCFFWPFNLDLGQGINLRWATAQPITAITDGDVRTVFFAATPGVPPQFAFDLNGAAARAVSGQLTREPDHVVARDIEPGTRVAVSLRSPGGQTVQIIVLSDAESLGFWKGDWEGRDRVFLTHASLVLDGNDLRLTSTNREELAVAVYPAPRTVESGQALRGKADGVFQRFAVSSPKAVAYGPTFEQIQPAGPPREIPIGKIDRPVATAPLDADFAKAAVWRIHIPEGVDLGVDPILRLHYVGDVARVTLNGKLLTDDFYNGNAFDVGLRRYAPEILTGDLRIAILPMRKDAPIYMAKEARPDFGAADSVVALPAIEIVPRYQVQLTASR